MEVLANTTVVAIFQSVSVSNQPIAHKLIQRYILIISQKKLERKKKTSQVRQSK